MLCRVRNEYLSKEKTGRADLERIAFNLNQIERGSKTDKPLGMLRISCNQVNLIARDTL